MRSLKLTILLLTGILFAWMVPLLHAKDNEQQFRLKPGASGKVCLKCHIAFKDKTAKPSVHTPVKNGECASCHNPHTSSHGKLLDMDAKNICSFCHSNVLPEKSQSVHKPAADGECMKCHDPHAAASRNNLLKEGTQLCFSCHKLMGERLAKIKHRHSPVEKGCATCHLAHASGKERFLLKTDERSLCIGCHKTDKPIFIKKHLDYPVAQSRCTGCHDPHGSNVSGILYDNVHKPILTRMCNQCHDEASSATPLKLKKDGMELCRGCHNDMFNKTFGSNRVHWPLMTKMSCLSCHNPHAGKQKGLLKSNMAQLCGGCHGDTMRRQLKIASKHEPIMEGNCTACHDPHASNFLFLGKKSPDFDLCVTCHDWTKHSTHPIGEKVRDPRNKNVGLSCTSCHRTHGTEFKKMLPFPTTTDLCIQCHEQYKR